MKLLTKLTLLSLGVSAMPLAIAGYSSLRIGQGALRGAIEENELTVARQVADHVGAELQHLSSILRVDARIFDLTRAGEDAPTPQGLLKFLQLVYHQSDDFCAVAMFDEHGSPVGTPAYIENPGDLRQLPQPRADAPHRRRVGRADGAARRGDEPRPGRRARSSWAARGACRTWCSPSRSIPTLGGGKRVLAAEVTLKRLGAYVASRSTTDTDVKLVDASARLIAAGSRLGVSHLEVQRFAAAREGELPAADSVAEYNDGDRRVIGAYTTIPPFGFGVVVDKTIDAALLPVNRIRFATLFWIGVSGVIGSIVARVFARRLSDRVDLLAGGLAPDRRRQPRDAHRGGRVGRARRSRARVQLDGDLARRRPPADPGADQRDHGLEPDAGEARRGRHARAAPGAGHAAALALAGGAGRAGRGRRARDQQPARRRAGHRAADARRPAGEPPGAADGAGHRGAGAAHPQDRRQPAAVRAAAGRRGREAARSAARARRRDRAVRAERSQRRRHHHRARLRDADAAGARQHRSSCRRRSSS